VWFPTQVLAKSKGLIHPITNTYSFQEPPMPRPDVDIVLLRSFLAVLDEGGFARAAAVIGRTQPAVSQQIRRLEDLLGCTLIERAAPGRIQAPRPTEAGERLAGQARRLIGMHDRMVADLTGAAPVAAVLRLGMHQHASDAVLGRLVAEAGRLRPGLALDLRIGATAQITADLAAGQLDLAFVLMTEDVDDRAAGAGAGDAGPRGQGTGPAGSVPVLWRGDAPALVADPDSALPVVAFRAPCVFRAAAVAALGRAGRRWRLAHEATDARSLMAALSAGLGIGAVPGIGRYDGLPTAPAALDLPPLPRARLQATASTAIGHALLAPLAAIAALDA
jgi:DNA-binding transcriptional LysR family regulator